MTRSFNEKKNLQTTCCLKQSALSALFAKIRRPETRRSNRCTAVKISQLVKENGEICRKEGLPSGI